MFLNVRKLMLPLAMGALIAGGVVAIPAAAQAPAAASLAPEFTKRAGELVPFINGEMGAEKLFAPEMLKQMSPDQLKTANEQMRSQMGKAVGVEGFEALGAREGKFAVKFEKGKLAMKMRLEDKDPYFINGVQITPPSGQ